MNNPTIRDLPQHTLTRNIMLNLQQKIRLRESIQLAYNAVRDHGTSAAVLMISDVHAPQDHATIRDLPLVAGLPPQHVQRAIDTGEPITIPMTYMDAYDLENQINGDGHNNPQPNPATVRIALLHPRGNKNIAYYYYRPRGATTSDHDEIDQLPALYARIAT